MPTEKEWLRRAVVEYLVEETGHDEWILSDIKSAGGDPEAVRRSKPSIAVDLMNAYNYDMIARRNPVGYFGMVFVLENASTARATRVADAIQKSLQLGSDCFTYLNSHGSIDVEHVEFIGKAISNITDPEDQDMIINASKVIYHLFSEMLRSVHCANGQPRKYLHSPDSKGIRGTI